jgi:hypothetical protein
MSKREDQAGQLQCFWSRSRATDNSSLGLVAHAYQATEGEQDVRQETYKSLTDSVICRSSPFGILDNAGVNRQQSTPYQFPRRTTA